MIRTYTRDSFVVMMNRYISRASAEHGMNLSIVQTNIIAHQIVRELAQIEGVRIVAHVAQCGAVCPHDDGYCTLSAKHGFDHHASYVNGHEECRWPKTKPGGVINP